jgi:hypothetical protein
MLPAVHLDDSFFLQAEKIDYIFTHRMLPPEFPAAELPIPEMMPEPSFGIGQAFSKDSGELGCQSCPPSP